MAGTQKRELTADNSRFQFSVAPSITTEKVGDTELRRFKGVAYSGEVVDGHYYWGSVVFDLSSMSVPAKLPALICHDRGQRAGYTTDSTIVNETGFTVAGNLLTNEYGASVAKDSDEGFPWQMSVDIKPGSVEEIHQGNSVTVNGRTYAGPITVFRSSRISEVSFTPTGWDSNTSATAMSRSGDTPPKPNDGESTMTKEEQDKLTADNATLKASADNLTAALASAKDELAQFSKQKRETDIKLLFSDTGREFKADDADVTELSAMSQEAFAAAAKFSRAAYKKPEGDNTNLGNLGRHFARDGADGNSGAKKSGLVANAAKRAEQFSKRG